MCGELAQADSVIPSWALTQRAETVAASSGAMVTQGSRPGAGWLQARNGAKATSTVRREARLPASAGRLRRPISTSRWAMSSRASVVLKAMRNGSSGDQSLGKFSARKLAIQVPADTRTTDRSPPERSQSPMLRAPASIARARS